MSTILLNTIAELLDAPSCALVNRYRIVIPETGVTEYSWEGVDAIAVTDTDGESYRAGFTAVDDIGLPAHTNAETSTNTILLSQTTNFTGTHQAMAEGYIYLEEGTELLEGAATLEASGVWIGKDRSSLVEVLDGVYPNPTNNSLGYYPAGVYFVRLYNSDASVAGLTRLKDSSGAVLPFYSEPVIQEEIELWLCDDGQLYNLDKSEVLDQDEYYKTPVFLETVSHIDTSGNNTDVPAGLKSYVIDVLTGTIEIRGGYTLSAIIDDNYPTSFNTSATETSLTSIEVLEGTEVVAVTADATWQWTGSYPVGV